MKRYTPLFKESINLDQLDSLGYKMVEQKYFGVYELTLLEAVGQNKQLMQQFGLPLYQLGLSREETDFTSIESQMTDTRKLPKGMRVKQEMAKGQKAIKGWIRQHGELGASSFNERKNRFYLKVLNKLGFSITPKTVDLGIQSQTVYVIS